MDKIQDIGVVKVNEYLNFLSLFGIGGAHPGGLQLTKKILESEELTEFTSILDAGCGTGQTATHIKSKYHCQVTAIDNHPIMIKKCKERVDLQELTINVRNENVEKLTLENNSFDVVLSESVIAFTNIERSLGELYRVLKNSGTLIAIEMTDEGFLSEVDKQAIKTFYGVSKIPTELNWINLLKAVGFKDISVVTATTFINQVENSKEVYNEFQMSPDIKKQYYDLFDLHEVYTQKFKNKLGYRVYKCKK
jgi:ubiquinone/menaquinone biosynthesis C-methylase UbiE